MACCYRYDSCTNPNDKCSRFVLSVPESMMELTGPLNGYKKEGEYYVRPDGSLVVSLNDAPKIKSRIEDEEKRPVMKSEAKLFSVAIIVLILCSGFFFVFGSLFDEVLFSFMGWVCAAGVLLWIVLYGIYNNS